MAWQQLELRLPARTLPRAEALLELLGAVSITLAGDGSEDILEPDPGTTPLWQVLCLRALFPPGLDLARAMRVLRASLGEDVAYTASALADADWTGALADEPRGVRIGRRLLIESSRAALHSDERVVVGLHRGLGFGTGDHPTTRLCLEWLDAALPAGATVLDYGCGSGILAIAALKLGAAQAWAVDVEPQALEGAADNAALNGVGERLWIGRPDALPTVAADVIVANILARPLVELAARFDALLARSGTLVLSGVLEHQLGEVQRAYAPRFEPFARDARAGWLRLVAGRAAA